MYKNFFYSPKLNFKKFLSYLPIKKNVILDLGCGNGVYTYENLKNNKIKLIKMTDKDKKLKIFIKKKYSRSKKITWSDNLNGNYDVVFINSVIQYMKINEYRNLLKFFIKKKIKIIIISDIPKFPRIFEAFFLIFLNPYKLIKGINYLFTKKYLNTGFFYKKYDELLVRDKSYICIKEKNLNDDQVLRYSLIIKKIK